MAGLLQFAPRSNSEGAPRFSPADYVSHALHRPERDWPQTNCYVDLWIEVIATHGFAPEAMLGFTVRQDFEGDQFTFFKPPHADLEFLYGLRVDELALYDSLEDHIETQLDRGRIVVVEVDSFYLPDTRGISYRSEHSKTTIGIVGFDGAQSQMLYFHNDGLFALENEDFLGVLGCAAEQKRDDALFPYAEFARFEEIAGPPVDVREKAEQLLRVHLARRPERNPVSAFSAAFPQLWQNLEKRPPAFFNVFVFNTLRQFGANFELLGSHLDWLRPDGAFARESAECRLLSSAAKALQFNVARAATRRRPFDPTQALDEMAAAYDRLFEGLLATLDGAR